MIKIMMRILATPTRDQARNFSSHSLLRAWICYKYVPVNDQLLLGASSEWQRKNSMLFTWTSSQIIGPALAGSAGPAPPALCFHFLCCVFLLCVPESHRPKLACCLVAWL